MELSAMSRERMKELIEPYYMLNRVTVGDETSLFTRHLASRLKVDVMSLPSGTKCLTWTVPDKWVVREAYIETLSGERVADFSWNPITLKSYSAPFSGIVSREELLKHVSSHPVLEDRLIYLNRWQYHKNHTEWGFSVPQTTVKNLKEDNYRVHVDTAFEQGELDIIDWILPGRSSETVFFSAHTCHPGQVNDGIACIAVLVELFLYLQSLPERHYTYRLIVGPEYYAAAAVLQHGKDIRHLRYGFYLDMMANSLPLSFSRSFHGNSYADRITRSVLANYDTDRLDAPYRGLYGNDEMFYDGPGFEIPTVCLSRHPYEYYHTDWDNFENCDFDKLEESLDMLKDIVETFETDTIPTRNYEGPLYLTDYNLYIDPKIDQKGYTALQEIQILMDGKRTCLDIAETIGVDFLFVRSFVNELHKHNLVTLKHAKELPAAADTAIFSPSTLLAEAMK
jgi:aminopeptidase-like protein